MSILTLGLVGHWKSLTFPCRGSTDGKPKGKGSKEEPSKSLLPWAGANAKTIPVNQEEMIPLDPLFDLSPACMTMFSCTKAFGHGALTD